MKFFRPALVCVALGAVLMGQSLLGQTTGGGTTGDPFASLHFRSIGPAIMSGRISDFAVYEANPAIFYVGTAHGGVWKTTNNGATFTPIFEKDGLMSIGDVAVSQKDPDLVWVGTGEGNNRQSIVVGRRHLQVHRRRQDVEEHGPRPLEPHQPHRHRSERQQHRLRRPRRGTSSAPAASAASTRRPTAARPGSAVIKVDADTGANESAWIRRSRTSCSRRCTSAGGPRAA